MKKTNYYVLSLLMAAGLAACSAEIDSTQQQGDQVPLQLTATKLVDNAEVQESHARRAANNLYTSSFDGGESVKVWLNSTDNSDNYTINSTDHTTLEDGSLYYPAGSTGTATVFALYPATSFSSHTVAHDQNGDAAYKLSDLMYATKTVNLSEKTSSQALQFSHQLVKLHVHIVKGSGVTSITSVKMKNVKRTVSVTPATTTCTIGEATAASDGNGDEIIIFSGSGTAATQDYACVFPIQAWDNADFIEIQADGQTATYKLTRSTWTKGSSYTLTLNVNTATLGTTISITGWNDGASATVTAGGGDFTISDIAAQTYTGSAIEPTPVVSYNNSPLTLNDDYTLEYAGNTNAGTAAVIAIGKGSYVGKVGVKEFTINKADCTVTLNKTSLTIYPNGTGIFTVTLPTGCTGTITATSSNTSKATTSVSQSGNTATVTVTHVAAGSATITVNVTESDNYKAYTASDKTVNVTCSDNPLASLTSSDVGKLIGADGNVYATATAATNAGTSAIAMIVYVGNAGTADASSNTYKGLAIALTDASTSAAWYTANSGTCVYQNSTLSEHTSYKDMKGIANTNQMADKTGTCASHTHDAATAAKNYKYNNSVAAGTTPANCSQWFLPSSGQWMRMLQGSFSITFSSWGSWASNGMDGYNNIKQKFTDAGVESSMFENAPYWSSSEYSTDCAVTVGFYSSGGVYVNSHLKSLTLRVRAFLAF